MARMIARTDGRIEYGSMLWHYPACSKRMIGHPKISIATRLHTHSIPLFLFARAFNATISRNIRSSRASSRVIASDRSPYNRITSAFVSSPPSSASRAAMSSIRDPRWFARSKRSSCASSTNSASRRSASSSSGVSVIIHQPYELEAHNSLAIDLAIAHPHFDDLRVINLQRLPCIKQLIGICPTWLPHVLPSSEETHNTMTSNTKINAEYGEHLCSDAFTFTDDR